MAGKKTSIYTTERLQEILNYYRMNSKEGAGAILGRLAARYDYIFNNAAGRLRGVFSVAEVEMLQAAAEGKTFQDPPWIRQYLCGLIVRRYGLEAPEVLALISKIEQLDAARLVVLADALERSVSWF